MSLSPFYLAYADLRARIAPFHLRTDFETRKTVANIDALLNRARELDAGAKPSARFGWAVGHTVENFMERAERYIAALEKGEYPCDEEYLAKIVRGVCYENAKKYFAFGE